MTFVESAGPYDSFERAASAFLWRETELGKHQERTSSFDDTL